MRLAVTTDDGKADENRKTILAMIYQYKQLSNQGYSDEAAYQKMVTKYRTLIEERKNHFRIVNNLKVSNGFRSLLDTYQQKAEYEARLKVSRMKRDLAMKDFLDKNELPEYERNVKIVNRSTVATQDRTIEKERFEQFFARSKNLLNIYYEKAYVRDRLNNLTDKEILYTIRETPSKIKKACKGILSQMEKNNIKVREDGTLDFSKCDNHHVKRKLENNPMVKYALLQESMDYGFIHLQAKKKTGEDIKRELLTLRAADLRQEEEETREQRELELKRQANQSEIDKKIGFISAGGFTSKDREEDSGRRHAEPSDLIEGTQYRTDERGALLESFPMRLARLEKLWMKERMANIEAGVENHDPEETRKRLEDLTYKVRRVKMQADRQALIEAQEMVFEEHQFLSTEELLTENTPLERLLNYYTLPVDQRQPGLIEDDEFANIRSMIRRKEIVEDLVPPFELSANSQLEYEDTQEMRERRIFRADESQEFENINMQQERKDENSKRSEQAINARSEPELKAAGKKRALQEKKKDSLMQKLKKRVEFGQEKRRSLGFLDGSESEADLEDAVPKQKQPKGGRQKKPVDKGKKAR